MFMTRFEKKNAAIGLGMFLFLLGMVLTVGSLMAQVEHRSAADHALVFQLLGLLSLVIAVPVIHWGRR